MIVKSTAVKIYENEGVHWDKCYSIQDEKPGKKKKPGTVELYSAWRHESPLGKKVQWWCLFSQTLLISLNFVTCAETEISN